MLLSACISVYYICAWCLKRLEESIINPWGLELQTVVSHHVGAEIEQETSGGAASTLSNHLTSPIIYTFYDYVPTGLCML